MSVRLLPVAFLLLALAIPASAQASFTGLYVQSFDDIGGAPNAELPEGWRVQTLPGIRALGDFADASTTTDAHGGNLFGQSAPTGAINFGSGPEATATERAIGFASNGDIGTGLLYFHFRVDVFGSFDEIWYAKSEETYRGGQDEAESQTEAFYSYDGSTWYALFGQGRTSGGDRDGYEDAPAAGGSSGAGRVDLPTPLQQGDELYLAFRYSAAPGWSTAQVPAEAFDDFVIGTSFSSLRHIFVGRGERVFGDVPVGETAGPLTVDYNPVGYSGEDPVVEITGPAAADFSVELNAPFNRAEVFFTPSEPGLREASLRFRIGSMVSREVALRGGSGEPAGEIVASVERVGDDAPIPAGGGRYRYRVLADIDGPDAREVDFWSDLLFPDGRVVTLREPEAVTLTPGETRSVAASRLIRAQWPTGTYTQRFYWGAYPDGAEAEASLSIEKVTGGEIDVAVERVGGDAPIPSDGGRYRYRVLASVNGPDAREVDFWSDLLLPDGSVVTVREPETVTLAPGETWRVGASRLIRGAWPTGTYTQRFYLGAFPDGVEAQTSLTIEKAAGALAARAASTGETEGPNPFRDRTVVRFEEGSGGFVRAELFDTVGRRVQVLYEGVAPEGRPLVVTVDGSDLPAGVYIVRLIGEDHSEARTLVRAR